MNRVLHHSGTRRQEAQRVDGRPEISPHIQALACGQLKVVADSCRLVMIILFAARWCGRVHGDTDTDKNTDGHAKHDRLGRAIRRVRYEPHVLQLLMKHGSNSVIAWQWAQL